MHYKYDTFISYHIDSDKVLARAISHALETHAKYWYQLRALDVYLDQQEMGMREGLTPQIKNALRFSASLTLLASPGAAKESTWVEREIEFWRANNGDCPIFLVLTSGELRWDQDAKDFDWRHATAIPTALKGFFREEPPYIDLRKLRDEPDGWNLRNANFRAAINQLSAAVRDKTPKEVDSLALTAYRRQLQLSWSVGAVLLALLAVAIYSYQRAEQERIKLERETRRLIVENLLSQAKTRYNESNYYISALTSMEAIARADQWGIPVPDQGIMLREALRRLMPLHSVHRFEGEVRALFASSDGRYLAACVTDENRQNVRGDRLHIYDLTKNRQVREVALDGFAAQVVFREGGARLLFATDARSDTLPLTQPQYDHGSALMDIRYDDDQHDVLRPLPWPSDALYRRAIFELSAKGDHLLAADDQSGVWSISITDSDEPMTLTTRAALPRDENELAVMVVSEIHISKNNETALFVNNKQLWYWDLRAASASPPVKVMFIGEGEEDRVHGFLRVSVSDDGRFFGAVLRRTREYFKVWRRGDPSNRRENAAVEVVGEWAPPSEMTRLVDVAWAKDGDIEVLKVLAEQDARGMLWTLPWSSTQRIGEAQRHPEHLGPAARHVYAHAIGTPMVTKQHDEFTTIDSVVVPTHQGIYVWDPYSGMERARAEAMMGAESDEMSNISSHTWAMGGERDIVAMGTSDGMLGIWYGGESSPVAVTSELGTSIYDLDFDATGSALLVLVSYSEHGEGLVLWPLEPEPEQLGEEPVTKLEDFSAYGSSDSGPVRIAFHPSDPCATVNLYWDGTYKVKPLQTEECKKRATKVHDAGVKGNVVRLARGGAYALARDQRGRLAVIKTDGRTRAQGPVVTDSELSEGDVALSSDGQYVALWRNQALETYAVDDGRLTARGTIVIETHDATPEAVEGPMSMEISPRGSWLAVVWRQEVLVYKLGDTGVYEPYASLYEQRLERTEEPHTLAFSHDGAFLAVGKQISIDVWDLAEKRLRAILPEAGTMSSRDGRHSVTAMSFSPDDRYIASGTGYMGQVYLWRWRPQDLMNDACRRLEWHLQRYSTLASEFPNAHKRCALSKQSK